jgi:hypothetical protein
MNNLIHRIARALSDYGYGKIELSAVSDILDNAVKESNTLYIYVGRHSPNYFCGYLMIFDGITEEDFWHKNKPFFHLSNKDDMEKIIEILRNKKFTGKFDTIMIGPNIGGYHEGYRLLYITKYGYDMVYQELYPDMYNEDIKVIQYWNSISYTPIPEFHSIQTSYQLK